MITRKNIINFLVFMMLVTTFLPIVSNNLPMLIGSFHVYALLFIVSIILFKSNILKDKNLVITLLIGGLLYGILPITIWSNMSKWNRFGQIEEFYSIVVALIVYYYYRLSNELITYGKLIKIVLLFILITCLASIFSSLINPMYARHLTGAQEAVFSIDDRNYFAKLGGGAYGFATAIVAVIPMLVYYYRYNQISPFSKSLLVPSLVLVFFTLVRMQIFANILVGIIVIILSFQKLKHLKKAVLYFSFFLFIAILIPNSIYADFLAVLSNFFDSSSETYFKLNDMSNYLIYGSQQATAAGYRANRYTELLNSFSQSPIFGVSFRKDALYDQAGGHLFWMNRIAVIGIFGIFFYIQIYIRNISFVLKNIFNSTFKVYYLLSIFSILGLGLIKNLAGRETWFMLFFILPGLYYLPLASKKSRKNYQNNDLSK